MGFSIDDNKIRLTRGDTLRTPVHIFLHGEEYIPETGDVVKFTVKKNEQSKSELISINVPIDTMILHIEPSHTKGLSFGLYKYDMQITFANGDVCTFIEPTEFKVMGEIG